MRIEFDVNRDIDAAANDVRDRVSRVLGNLPEEADPPEIIKADASADPIMFMSFSSDSMSMLEVTDYAERNLIDRLSTVPGVARVSIGGGRRYAMRIWIDRQALAARQLTVTDIEDALRRENVELPAGRLESRTREFSLRTLVGLETEEDFRNLVIARGEDGHLVRLGEVANVQLAAENERIVHALQRQDRRRHVGRSAIEGQYARHRARRARRDRAHAARRCRRARTLDISVDNAHRDRGGAARSRHRRSCFALDLRARRDLRLPRQSARDADSRASRFRSRSSRRSR